MTPVGDLAALTETVSRLRAMHHDAADEDRQLVALSLGLAIADLVARLPEDDPRVSELAEEGLRRLEEAADSTPAAVRAGEVLRRVTARRERSWEEETVPLPGPDLSWDVDWSVLQGPAQDARQLLQTLPFLANMLPPQAPLRQALTDIGNVMSAFDQGQWSPEHDKALAAASRQVAAAGLGSGIGLVLRMLGLTIRIQRCRSAEGQGLQADWPAPAELDGLIADLESSDDITRGLGPTFQAVDGLHHLYIAWAIMMRVLVGARRGDVPKDESWRVGLLQLLHRADEHLRQVPPAYAGQVRQMRAQLAQATAALSSAPAATTSPPPRPARSPSAPTRPAPAPSVPPAPPPASTPPPAAADAEHPAVPAPEEPAGVTPRHQFLDPALTGISQQTLAGLGIIAREAGGPIGTGLSALISITDAAVTRRWDGEHEEQLATLRREVERLASADEQAADLPVLTAMLATADAYRMQRLAASPRPEDRPTAADLARMVTEVEASLENLSRLPAQGTGLPVSLTMPLHGMASALLVDLAKVDAQRRAELFARARVHFDQLPAEMIATMPGLRQMSTLQQLMEGSIRPDDDAVKSVIEQAPDLWDQTGAGVRLAREVAAKARQSQAPEDIAAAMTELLMVWTGLPAGSPVRAEVLTALAGMQSLLAGTTGRLDLALDAVGTAIQALRMGGTADNARAAARAFVSMCCQMTANGHYPGPFDEALETVRAALANADPEDGALRAALATATSAAIGMRGEWLDDDGLRTESRQLIVDACAMLPAATPTVAWYGAAQSVGAWAAVRALHCHDAESVPLALAVIGPMESALSGSPTLSQELDGPQDLPAGPSRPGQLETIRRLREQLLTAGQADDSAAGAAPSGQPGNAAEDRRLARAQAAQSRRLALTSVDRAASALGLDSAPPRRPLAPDGRPAPETLRAIAAELHQAMPGAADDTGLRREIDRLIGLCQAEVYWAEASARDVAVLREAVVHLGRALLSGEHALPSVEWADMLGMLARCYREAATRQDDAQARRAAEHTARAALQELARCVMIAEGTENGLATAARGNEIMSSAIGWALADGRHRVAMNLAEAGRGLVLTSVVLSGRVEEILRGAGEGAVADMWRAGTESGRMAALDALHGTMHGGTLLRAPIGEETSVAMISTQLDGLVYLVPPGTADAGAPDGDPTQATGYAIMLRPVLGEVSVLPLPGLAGPAAAPLRDYLGAFGGALSRQAPGMGGFRGGPDGQAWADALVTLGGWAYDRIMGPVIGHVRGWRLDHLPHLALIPLGELAAVPYAAAWTEAPAPTGTEPPEVAVSRPARRYAIDDVILSYAASARLLGEVSRRKRQPLADRVVLVTDATGMFPMSRRVTQSLASRQYPHAEVYGPRHAPSGPPTIAALLGALPGREQLGASLLQLTTHATADPAPALQARDGWLSLARILEQARGRALDAPGGLVIINACLTDSTRADYDESLTLATAFLAAGATDVIGTRWPVDDDTTAALNLRVHHHLQVGFPPADALRRAQLDLLRPRPDMRSTLGPILAVIEDSRLSHPVSWAGHVHHGIS